jgi:hypothetical protein
MNDVMSEQDLDRLLDTWDAPSPSPSVRASLLVSFPRPAPRKLFGIRLRWLMVAAACLLTIAGLAGSLLRGEPIISRGWRQLADGTYVRSTCLVEPPYAIFKWFTLSGGSASRSEGDRVWVRDCYHTDRSSQTYVGYTLRIESLEDGGHRVSVEPLARSLSQISPYAIGDYRQIPLPAIPSPRNIRSGEAFEFDIRKQGGERIYDRIELSAKPFPDDPQRGAKPPEAQALATSALSVESPRLYLNGQLLATLPGRASGQTVWVYLPDRGRYLIALSAAGNSNFVQAGRVAGNTIEFRDGDDRFRLESAQPIAAASGEQPVFVFHQSDFRMNPESPAARGPQLGSAGAPAFHR